MHEQFKELKSLLAVIYDLEGATSLLEWDQATYMPAGGAVARARQLSTLRRLEHELYTSPKVGALLEQLQDSENTFGYDSDEASLLRVVRRTYQRKTKIPAALIAEVSQHLSESYIVWSQARPKSDFAAVLPYMKKTLELSRRIAECFPGSSHIADPLIDSSDRGMTVSKIQPLFVELRTHLVPMLQTVLARKGADTAFMHREFAEQKQIEFGWKVIERFGYDRARGRQDLTHHPFMTKFSLDDVRITTRVKKNDLSEALFSTLHEAGHALYEQGIASSFEGTALAHGASSGVHESQSRLWENLVGRSRELWSFFYPQLQEVFPAQLGEISLEQFYRAINDVKQSLIRTDADELTYNLHVMIRFDLELEMLEGSLAIEDLPDAWAARYKSDLGVEVPNHSSGVMQDVHWFGGTIGGEFQGYTLGNILSAQFYSAASSAIPNLSALIGDGEFGQLRAWLTENVYRHGCKYTPLELVKKATGRDLQIAPYINYLRTKFTA